MSDTKKRDFDQEAATWETPPRIKLAKDVGGAMLRRVGLTREMDVLDFGSGTGLITFQFAQQVRSVTAADTSSGMLAVLRNKAQGLSLKNVRTIHLSGSEDGKIAGPYDLITSSMTLHHVQDIQKLFKQFSQALRPGGQIALADLDQEDGRFHDNNDGVFHFGFDRERLGEQLKGAGFADVSFSTVANMNKPGPDGQDRVFSLFLVSARKS